MIPDLASLIEPILTISREAGAKVLEIYREDEVKIRSKSDDSPVTCADIAAHEIIGGGLEELTPEIPVLSEESVDVAFETRSSWETFWLVDPLDGTREFIKRSGEFTVNVALIRQHEPILGVIYAPVHEVIYYAWRFGGAFKVKDADPKPQKIYSRPLDETPVRVAGSRSYAVKALQTFLRRLDNYEYVGVGSALKSCLIAEGAIDVYPRLGPTSEWDTAAAQCILEEAGGQLTDIWMSPLRYNTGPSLLNPPFIAFGDDRRNWSEFIPEQFREKERERLRSAR